MMHDAFPERQQKQEHMAGKTCLQLELPWPSRSLASSGAEIVEVQVV